MVAIAMIFASPWWLLVLPILAAAAVFFWKFSRKYSERRIGLFVSPNSAREAVPSVDHRWQIARFAVPAAVLGFVCLALARPLIGPKPGHGERKGVDFVVALDVSKSMWAEDVPPNRLDAVKKEIADWLKQASGDRMGLVIFAGEALIQAPVTFDYEALDRVLQAAVPKAISKGGTNIPSAIEMASTLLDKTGMDTRALVIFTDGENLDGDAVAAASAARAKDGLTIFTVGIGSAAGAKVPQVDHKEFAKMKPDQRKWRGYARNEYGTEVLSRLDEHALRAIATAGGGRYEPFVPESGFMQKFRDSALLPLAKNRKILNVQDYYELFPIPLALAILLLMIEPLIPVVKKRRQAAGVGVAVVRPETYSGAVEVPVEFAKKKTRPGVTTAIFLLFGLICSASASDGLDRQAAQLLRDGKAAEAVALVKAAVDAAPGDPVLGYNYGITLYQAGKLEEAIEVFQNLKPPPENEVLRAKILFQLGNAQFRLAEKLGSQPSAVLSLERALAFYDQLLTIRSNPDYKLNQETTKKALEEILSKIAADRLKVAEELAKKNDTQNQSKALKEALDAQERLTTLEPDNKKFAADKEETKKKLAEALKATAAKKIAEADKVEEKNDAKQDGAVLGNRQQSIDLLEQAQEMAPKDESIPKAIKEQQAKMSDLITKRAEAKVTPALAKEKMGSNDMEALNKGRQELAKALELNPDNARAADLKSKTDQKLENEFLARGENSLKAAEKPNTAENKLRAASTASENFQKALEVKPDSKPAAEGLAKVEQMLPALHAAAAENDLAAAQKLLGAQEKKPDDLEKAVGHLEKSTQNFARSLAIKPEDQNVQKRYDDAQKMLSDSRDQLDQNRQANNAEKGEPSDQGKDSQDAKDGKPGAEPKMQVYSPRQPPGKPATSAGAFWNKSNRDW